MLKCLSQFLSAHWDGQTPLLLGYSGGPDSKALLYALLEVGCRALHLAHVDHGWRLESEREAALLREESAHLGLPFHSIRLHNVHGEAAAREARFAFFRSLPGFQALLLAHQADDLAETVLKRVLEGAHLSLLGGIEPISTQQGLTIWRPLLSVRRKELLAFLQERRLVPIDDPTNRDPAYLRARMRTEILPMLAERFGKEIADNLSLLSQRSSELKAYLDKQISELKGNHGPWGIYYDLSHLERIEARHFLKTKTSLSRELLESILDAIFAQKPNCRFSPELIVDRGYIFFLAPQSGEWILTTGEGIPSRPDWKNIWSGHFASTGTWNNKKAPAFFRPIASAVVKKFVLEEKGLVSTLSFSTG